MRVSRERATLWGLLVVTSLCLGSAAAWAQAPAGGEQTAQAPLEPDVLLTEAERAEASKLLPLMNDAMRDQPVPSDISVDLGYDFFKAQPGQVYVPFTLKLDPATVSQSITLYVRLAPAGMMLPPPPPEPPSPMMTAITGTRSPTLTSIDRAMASACPRSSAPTPG